MGIHTFREEDSDLEYDPAGLPGTAALLKEHGDVAIVPVLFCGKRLTSTISIGTGAGKVFDRIKNLKPWGAEALPSTIRPTAK